MTAPSHATVAPGLACPLPPPTLSKILRTLLTGNSFLDAGLAGGLARALIFEILFLVNLFIIDSCQKYEHAKSLNTCRPNKSLLKFFSCLETL